ncbi:MAG: copper resistance protein B [Dokdonella sp.]
MKTNFRRSSVAALLAGAFLAIPSWAVAQDGADAATPHAHDMAGMDHSDMAHADMAHAQAPKEPAATPALDHDALHGMGSASDSVPANARSPDYSDGIGYHAMQGMDMLDNAPFGMLLVDRIEAFHGSNANGQAWEVEGWYGNDVNKLWLRSEGERSGGSLKDADLEAFWNRTVTAFWSTQVGVRHDFGEGPSRTWAAVGVQGLAPYWFELEATAYVGAAGRTAARVRADYELLLTQRLILQPEVEINLYGRDDPARHIGSGLSDVQFGLRLRYEISRQFAPYLGVNWIRSVGTTADYARDISQPVLDRQVVAGIRLWF